MGDKNKTGAAAQGAGKPRVLEVRGKRVVLDRELAALVGIDTKYLKRIVKRNHSLFNGDDLVFELTQEESLRCQTETEFDVQGDKFVTLNNGRGSNIKYLPYAFTEEGVKMLEKVLKRSIEVEFQEQELLPVKTDETWSEGIIEVYQPDENIKINVMVDKKTVWLTQEQMAIILGTTQPNIAMHIRNIYKDEELEKWKTYKKILYVQTEGGHQTRRYINIYNLDLMISLGFRVNSRNGILFRNWANEIVQRYFFREHYYEVRMDVQDRKIEDQNIKIDAQDVKIEDQGNQIKEQGKQLKCIAGLLALRVDADIQPKVGLLSGNSVYDAHVFVSGLVEKAEKHITIIDPYIDSSVLVLLTKRLPGVNVEIYYDDTKLQNKPAFNQDLALHNKQYPTVTLTHVDLLHDRFFIVDDETYHIGASIKDLGKKMFAFDTIPFTEQEVLRKIGVL